MTPEFSVIVPVRGDSPHLRAALDSARRSDVRGEILVCHDRRSGEPELPADIGAGGAVCFESPSVGPAAARNAALDRARGRFVAFLDDDDLWLPSHLGRAADQLESHPGTVLYASDAWLFDDPSETGASAAPDDPSSLPRFAAGRPAGLITLRELLLANPILTPTVVLVRDALGPEDRFDTELPVMEDYEFWIRLAGRHRLAFDAWPGAIVRRRPGSASADLRAMAGSSLRILEGLSRDGAPPSPLSRAEWRRRLGRLRHELAYACLVAGDATEAGRAARESIRHMPWLAKSYAYLGLALLPPRLRGPFRPPPGVDG